MKTKTSPRPATKLVMRKEFAIFCFSDILGEFAPSLWPNQLSESEAKTFARDHVKHTKYEVRPVTTTARVPR